MTTDYEPLSAWLEKIARECEAPEFGRVVGAITLEEWSSYMRAYEEIALAIRGHVESDDTAEMKVFLIGKRIQKLRDWGYMA